MGNKFKLTAAAMNGLLLAMTSQDGEVYGKIGSAFTMAHDGVGAAPAMDKGPDLSPKV
jgi:hypothetical protein